MVAETTTPAARPRQPGARRESGNVSRGATMATDRPSPAKKSKGNMRPTEQSTQGRTTAQGRPVRAHRDDTPEARQQRAGTPKTHPTRSAGAARKDSTAKHPRNA